MRKECSIIEDYSLIDRDKRILINVTFVPNKLVILSKPKYSENLAAFWIVEQT